MLIRFGDPFKILLVWSDKTLSVGEDETALQVLLAADVPSEPGGWSS